MARLICDMCGCEIEGVYHVRYIRMGRLNSDESRYYTYCRDCASSIEKMVKHHARTGYRTSQALIGDGFNDRNLLRRMRGELRNMIMDAEKEKRESMDGAKYFVRRTTKKKFVFAPEHRYRTFDTIEGPGGLVDTLLDDGWYIIERGSDYIFAFHEKEYALFRWRKEY